MRLCDFFINRNPALSSEEMIAGAASLVFLYLKITSISKQTLCFI